MHEPSKADTTRDTLLMRGLAVEACLPGMLAVEVADLVNKGEFADMNELILVAVGSYLDMRRHEDVALLLRQRLFDEAVARTDKPRTFAQGLADVLARLELPRPMSAGEAMPALA
jgi:Arc/MetJ-type ribon-helix-helix transcriptional regulator